MNAETNPLRSIVEDPNFPDSYNISEDTASRARDLSASYDKILGKIEANDEYTLFLQDVSRRGIRILELNEYLTNKGIDGGLPDIQNRIINGILSKQNVAELRNGLETIEISAGTPEAQPDEQGYPPPPENTEPVPEPVQPWIKKRKQNTLLRRTREKAEKPHKSISARARKPLLNAVAAITISAKSRKTAQTPPPIALGNPSQNDNINITYLVPAGHQIIKPDNPQYTSPAEAERNYTQKQRNQSLQFGQRILQRPRQQNFHRNG
jgi:hypothetical protein